MAQQSNIFIQVTGAKEWTKGANRRVYFTFNTNAKVKPTMYIVNAGGTKDKTIKVGRHTIGYKGLSVACAKQLANQCLYGICA